VAGMAAQFFEQRSGGDVPNDHHIVLTAAH
jgi:hypothetical protein